MVVVVVVDSDERESLLSLVSLLTSNVDGVEGSCDGAIDAKRRRER